MSADQLPKNFLIISQRWPQLFEELMSSDDSSLNVEIVENTLVINGIQLTSSYDRLAEAELQTSFINSHSNHATVYGPGLGDSINVLLARKALRKIYVVILNRAIFINSLQAIENMDWLSDPRVQLQLATKDSAVNIPFCVNPAELKLADTKGEYIADKVQIELNQEFVNKKHQHRQVNNSDPIRDNYTFIETDADISSIPNPKKTDIFIAAAGPTLEQHLDYLAKNKPFIIAVDASVRVLLNHGIIPNIVVSIDYTAFQFFEDIEPSLLTNSMLVYFPNVETSVLNYWPGPRYCSYSPTPLYQEILDKYPKTQLFCAGSVVHPAIDLAVYLQAKNIILLGTDFAFTFNKSHASDSTAQKASHELDLGYAKESIINGLGMRIPTMASLKGYLRDLEEYIKEHPSITFSNGSLEGALIEGTKLWQH
ncbi:motility associated factor glycosyltransferase family protein [Thalassotalea piscium]